MGNNLRTQKTELQLFFFISQPFKKYKPLSILKNVHGILIQHPQHYKTKETERTARQDQIISADLVGRARPASGGRVPPPCPASVITEPDRRTCPQGTTLLIRAGHSCRAKILKLIPFFPFRLGDEFGGRVGW